MSNSIYTPRAYFFMIIRPGASILKDVHSYIILVAVYYAAGMVLCVSCLQRGAPELLR
jgi:hypothetical protein